jgi:hypothetical protein
MTSPYDPRNALNFFGADKRRNKGNVFYVYQTYVQNFNEQARKAQEMAEKKKQLEREAALKAEAEKKGLPAPEIRGLRMPKVTPRDVSELSMLTWWLNDKVAMEELEKQGICLRTYLMHEPRIVQWFYNAIEKDCVPDFLMGIRPIKKAKTTAGDDDAEEEDDEDHEEEDEEEDDEQDDEDHEEEDAEPNGEEDQVEIPNCIDDEDSLFDAILEHGTRTMKRGRGAPVRRTRAGPRGGRVGHYRGSFKPQAGKNRGSPKPQAGKNRGSPKPQAAHRGCRSPSKSPPPQKPAVDMTHIKTTQLHEFNMLKQSNEIVVILNEACDDDGLLFNGINTFAALAIGDKPTLDEEDRRLITIARDMPGVIYWSNFAPNLKEAFMNWGERFFHQHQDSVWVELIDAEPPTPARYPQLQANVVSTIGLGKRLNSSALFVEFSPDIRYSEDYVQKTWKQFCNPEVICCFGTFEAIRRYVQKEALVSHTDLPKFVRMRKAYTTLLNDFGDHVSDTEYSSLIDDFENFCERSIAHFPKNLLNPDLRKIIDEFNKWADVHDESSSGKYDATALIQVRKKLVTAAESLNSFPEFLLWEQKNDKTLEDEFIKHPGMWASYRATYRLLSGARDYVEDTVSDKDREIVRLQKELAKLQGSMRTPDKAVPSQAGTSEFQCQTDPSQAIASGAGASELPVVPSKGNASAASVSRKKAGKKAGNASAASVSRKTIENQEPPVDQEKKTRSGRPVKRRDIWDSSVKTSFSSPGPSMGPSRIMSVVTSPNVHTPEAEKEEEDGEKEDGDEEDGDEEDGEEEDGDEEDGDEEDGDEEDGEEEEDGDN